MEGAAAGGGAVFDALPHAAAPSAHASETAMHKPEINPLMS
jgi:hypothetical protein